jgi:glycosyltransferase involved in cell wall biosynthesis
MADTNHAAYRDTVLPVPAHARRPKWSVMVPVYNNSRHLRSTLESVLKQDPGPEFMQIEVVDDFSSDEPEKIMRDVAGDRISYFRQERNLGHIQNFHTCITRARGEIVHLLHGDDLVRQGFYKELQVGFDREPATGAAFCRPIYIDEMGLELSIAPPEQSNSGPLANAALRLASEQKVMTPCIAVRRAVYEQLGGFDRRLICSEDWEMWVRIAAQFPIWYVPQPLACYRIHKNSNTGRHTRNAEDAAYTRKAIQIFSSYLPPDAAKLVAGKARRTYAMSTLRTASRLLQEGDWMGYFSQTREAIRLHPSPGTVLRAVKILVKER